MVVAAAAGAVVVVVVVAGVIEFPLALDFKGEIEPELGEVLSFGFGSTLEGEAYLVVVVVGGALLDFGEDVFIGLIEEDFKGEKEAERADDDADDDEETEFIVGVVAVLFKGENGFLLLTDEAEVVVALVIEEAEGRAGEVKFLAGDLPLLLVVLVLFVKLGEEKEAPNLTRLGLCRGGEDVEVNFAENEEALDEA